MIFFYYNPCIDVKNYFIAVENFTQVAGVITKKLNDMERENISPDKVHLYGFSFGAQAVILGAYNFGPQKVGSIDGKRILFNSKWRDLNLTEYVF